MRPALTAEEMRSCDEFAIDKLGIPGLLLMENAGAAVATVLCRQYAPISRKTAVFFCGKGNNGGDGFVAARHLFDAGARVNVILMSPPGALEGDAKTNFEIVKELQREKLSGLEVNRFSPASLKTLKADLVVDAMFGTGFSGKVSEPFATVIDWMNSQRLPVISVDIPSGVNGTTGAVENTAVHATETVTLAFEKIGLRCNQGQEYSGRIHVADIGIPLSAVGGLKSVAFVVEPSDVAKALPQRPKTAHKYSVGSVFVVAGSKGMTGAAAMSSISALRSGAGAVVLGTPDAVYPILARKLTEVMVMPLPATSEGSLSQDGFVAVKEKMEWADVTVIGPGLSQNKETQLLVRAVVHDCSGKLLIDADGLNAIGLKELKSSKADIIVTPHTGEFSRLTGRSSKEIEADRVRSAREGASSTGHVVVLKGAPTATGTIEGTVYLNSTGNPGMATAGSGDVLSGIIAGLWAQGMKAEEAAYSGVFLHGLAGDLAREKYGERSLLATDLIEFLPQAFRHVELERHS